MVTENRILDVSVRAGEDLSADQYRFVVRDKTTKKIRRPDSKVEVPDGILQNAPAATDREAVIRTDGFSKMRIGGPVAIGDKLVAEFISAADAGKGIVAADGYHYVRAQVTDILGTAAEDELVQVRLIGPDSAFERITITLPAFTANATVDFGVMPVQRDIKVIAISTAAVIKPADADGTCLLSILNWDISGTPADDALLSAAVDMETLTAKTTMDLTLTATGADLVLADGDYIHGTLVNNSAAIDTNWAGASLTIEYELL